MILHKFFFEDLVFQQMQVDYCSLRVKDLEQTFVDIYWPGHGRWYPGFLVCFDESSGFGEVEFEDGAFDNEIVESKQIRPRREMTVTTASPSTTVSSGKQLAEGRARPTAAPAGTFKHEQFLSYVCDLHAHSKSILPVASIADPYVMARVKACMFSKHAEERILQRYPTRLQEFQRSLSTNQDCAILMDRRVMLCLPVRINGECSEEVGLVFNWEFDKFIEQRVPGKKKHYLTKRNVIGEESICEHTHAGHSAADKVASALLARNRSASGTDNVMDFCAADISYALQYECYDMSVMVLTTTTSTLILSWDYKRLVTCFFNRIGYSDWIDRQRQRQAGVARKAKAKAFTRAGKK